MRAAAETLAAYGAGSDPARQAHQAYPNARDAVAGACRDDGPVPVRRSGLACFLAHYVRELDGAGRGHWRMPLPSEVCDRLRGAADDVSLAAGAGSLGGL